VQHVCVTSTLSPILEFCICCEALVCFEWQNIPDGTTCTVRCCISVQSLYCYTYDQCANLAACRCAFSNCQHLQEPGCCLHEDFDRHPIYVELYHEVKQNKDLERHRSMSKKVSFPTSTWKTKVSLSSVFLQLSMSSSCAISHFKAACRHSFRHEMT